MCWSEFTEALVGVVQYRGRVHPVFDLNSITQQVQDSFDVVSMDQPGVDEMVGRILDLRLDEVEGCPFYLVSS